MLDQWAKKAALTRGRKKQHSIDVHFEASQNTPFSLTNSAIPK
jgi:hypothetical protein